MPTRRQLLLGAAAAAVAGPALAQAAGEDARLAALLGDIFEAGVDKSPERATSHVPLLTLALRPFWQLKPPFDRR